jgi:hypothetical protein
VGNVVKGARQLQYVTYGTQFQLVLILASLSLNVYFLPSQTRALKDRHIVVKHLPCLSAFTLVRRILFLTKRRQRYVLGGQGSERRDNLAYESYASRRYKALSIMARKNVLRCLIDRATEKL